MKNKLLTGIGLIIGTIIYQTYNYADIRLTKTEIGRTKNSIATVVSGIAGQKMYGNAIIDVEVQKRMWPDSKVTGTTTKSDITTFSNLTLSYVRFSAENNQSGQLEGEVDKSEFDGGIKQTGENTYHITRFGLKFDSDLELKVANGQITGKYIRHGPNFDWDIEGTYDKSGNINIEIDGPMTPGIVLDGKITKK